MTTGLSDAHQLQIENTIKQISDLHPVEGTYLTGSLAADLGSTLSDLDLVCVVATAEPVQRFPLRGELALHEGTVADAEVLTTSQYGATTKIVNAWNPDATGHWKVFGLREELRTLSRLLYGRPVTGNAVHSRLIADIDLDNFRRAYTTFHLADAANYLRDTVGLVESGDLETAWETSTRVSRIAGEALLGAYGDYYHADKFMLRRLRRRTETSVIAEQFADALYWPTGIRGTNAELIDAIEWRKTLTGHISAVIFLTGWSATATETVPELPTRAGAYRRSTESLLIRASDGALILGRHSLRLSVAQGLLWALADFAETRDGLIESFLDAVGLDTSNTPWVANTLSQLIELRLIQSAQP